MPPMPSLALKKFASLWAEACKTMWVEVAALRHLESTIRGNFASIPEDAVLTDWIYAPECRRRIDDSRKGAVLDNMDRWISAAATSRVVLLAAGFEAYFEEFLDAYLKHRPKFYAAGAFTAAGNKANGEIIKCRGPVPRIEALHAWTGAKIASIQPHLPVLAQVYALRNVMAHDAGIVDSHTGTLVTVVPVRVGDALRLTPDQVARVLAPPVVRLAELLDAKINTH
jgi:hypothetical protein